MFLESGFSSPIIATASDLLAPAKVLNLAYTVEQGKVIVTWDAVTTNSDTTVLADLAGYRVYRKDAAEDSFSVIATVAATVDSQVTTHEDTTALDGASYIYAVSAIDDESTPNEGAQSDDLAVKTIPSVPINVAATSGDGTIRITWDAVTDEDTPKKNENLNGYRVYRKLQSDGGAHAFLAQVVSGVNIYDDETVVNGETYSYVVTAIDNSL